MPDPTEEFFDRLGRCRHEPKLARFTGTIRFDLKREQGVDHWLLEIAGADLHVHRGKGSADLVIIADRDAFNQVVNGQQHPFATLLRTELRLDGDVRLLNVLRILVAGPEPARHPRSLVTTGGGARGR